MANNNGIDNLTTDINKEALTNNSELGTENNTNTPQQASGGTAAPNNPDGTAESHSSSVAGETAQNAEQKLTISIDKIEEIKNDIRNSIEKGIPSDEQEKDILNNEFENLASAMETFSDSLNTEKGKEEFENSKEYSEEAGLIIQDIKDNDGTKDDEIKEKILNLLDKTIPQTIDKVLSVDKEAMLNPRNDVDETNNDEKGNLNHIDLSQFEKNSDLFKDAFKDVAADNKQEVFDKLCDIYQNSHPDINTNDATIITHAICKIYEEDKLEKINAARTSIHTEKDSLLGITKGYRYESKKEIGNFEKSLDRISGEIDNLGKNLTSDASIAKYQELKEDFASIRTGLEKGLENIKAVRSDQKIKEFRRDIYESLDSIDKKIDEIKENEFVVIGNNIDVHIEEVDTKDNNIEKEDKPETIYKDPEKTGDAKVDRFNAVLSRYEFAASIGKWDTKGKNNTSADNEQKGLENSQQSSSTISRKENNPFYTWNTLVRDIYAHSRGILINGAPVTTERIISDIENIIQSQGIPGAIIIGIIGGICVLIERLIHGAEKGEADHVEKNEEIQDFIKELYDKIEQEYSTPDDIETTTEQNQVDQNEENDQPNDISNDETQEANVDKDDKKDQPQGTEKKAEDDKDKIETSKDESKDTESSKEDTKENSIESKEEEKQENQKDQTDKSEENSNTDSKVDQDEKDTDPIDNQELEEENNQNIEADEPEEKIETDSNNTENKEETVVEVEESEQKSVDQEDSDKEESVEQEQDDTEIQDENKDVEESEEETDQTETNEEETESVEAAEVDDQDEPEDSAAEGKIEQEKPEEDTSNEDDAVAAMDDSDDEEQKKKDSGAGEDSSSDSQEGEDTQDESDSDSADVDGHSEENNPEEEVDAKEAATGDDKSERDEQTGITKDEEEKENVESSENNAEQNDAIDNLSEGMQDASLDATNEEAANKIEEGSTNNEGTIETTTVDPTEEYKADISEEQGVLFVDSVLSNLETNGGDINDIIVDEILDRGGEPIDFSADMDKLINQGYDIDVDYISDAVYDVSTEFVEPNVSFKFGDDEIYAVGNSDSGVTPQNTSVEAYDNDINDIDIESMIDTTASDFATYTEDTIEAMISDTTLPDVDKPELDDKIDSVDNGLELNQLEKVNASDNLENAADNASKDSDPSDNESNNRVDMIEPSQYQNNDDTSESDFEIDYDSIFKE